MQLFDIIYIFLSVFVLLTLGLVITKTYKSKSQYKISFYETIICAVIAVVSYCLFFILPRTDSYKIPAMIFETWYFICTDFLVFYMLKFAIKYTNFNQKTVFFKYFLLTCFCICFLDLINLVINAILFAKFGDSYSFVISARSMSIYDSKVPKIIVLLLEHYKQYRFSYWTYNLKPLHWLHLSFCYVMVVTTYIVLFRSAMQQSKFYKMRSIGMIIAYFIIVIMNFVSYTFYLFIDISVLGYGILAIFLAYFTEYAVPSSLIKHILQSVNDSMSDGIVYLNEDNRCLYVNPKAQELFDWNDGNYINNIESFLKQHLVEMKDSLIGTAEWEANFIVQGETRYLRIYYTELNYKQDFICSYLRMSDETENIIQFKNDVHAATHDQLTDLYNREYFFECCDKLIQEDPFTTRLMLASNVRDFKVINHIFGYEVGTKILLKHAELFRKYASSDTIYAHICDDKFAMLIRKENFDSKFFIQKINEIAELTDKSNYLIHIIFGICEVYGGNDSASVLYDKALLAISKIESEYNKFYSFYDSTLIEKQLMEKHISTEFEDALKNNDFKLYLQPIFTKDGDLCGAEALSRWVHPVRGLLTPESYIHILEKIGLIHKLDAYMFEQAYKQIADWQQAGHNDLFISVNVSYKDIFYMDIYGIVKELNQKYAINPKMLKFEFPEKSIAENYEKVNKLFIQLRELGHEIEIDDFGHGYSSLNLLKDYTIDVFKIHLDYFINSGKINKNKVILKYIISMSKDLDISVIFEVLENNEQITFAKNLGVDYFQGNYFSNTISIDDFTKKYLS